MKKVLNQTVRDLKREVNKMVLKVPSIEQKTLDATSNEPWAPRGSLMAEIAQASCNHNDYQLVMAVLWKRIQDTGKNWRHVYKALSVLEYLAIYGSERVIDDIREHAYQISTLSDFLYTDSNGRDQGSNVRRKSQSLVALVNNKKRLQEVRDKALANKVSWPPLSSSARYNDDHFEGGNRGFGLVQRDLVLKDKDRYRDGGDKYSQDRPRSPGVDVCSNNSFDDCDRHSTRIDAPPSYEGAAKDSWSVVQNVKSGPTETSSGDKNLSSESVAGESAQAHEKEDASFDEFDPRGSVTASPTVESRGLELDIFGLSAVDYTDSSASMLVTSTALPDDYMLTSSANAVPIEPNENPFGDAPDLANGQNSSANSDLFASEFSAAANSSKDILDGILPWTGPVASISDQSHLLPQQLFSAYSASPAHNSLETGSADLQLGQTNPFELPAFQQQDQAIPSSSSSQISQSASAPLQRPMESSSGVPVSSQAAPQAPSMSAFASRSSISDQSHVLPQQLFSAYSASPVHNSLETGSADLQLGQTNPFEQAEPPSHHLAGQTPPPPPATSAPHHAGQSAAPANYQGLQINNNSQQQNEAIPSSSSSQISQLALQRTVESSSGVPVSSQAARQAASMSSLNSRSSLPDLPISSPGSAKPQPSGKKFEPKSAVWADTISRGLVNLNISGPRTNPLADIGVDFDDINRKERRNEARGSQSPSSSSSFAMGKAMGIGSGLGRAVTGTFCTRSPMNPSMASSNMGMGMGMGMELPGFHGAHSPINGGAGHDGRHRPYGRGGLS